MATDSIVPKLGLGLIGIGRPWGHKYSGMPTEKRVQELLDAALELGITFWDTASSYGTSEERIGNYLRSLPTAKRESVFVSTKFGDQWEPGAKDSYADHSFEALRRSLDRSLAKLPKIHLLHVHRAKAETLKNDDVLRALEYARKCGITAFGASVKEKDAAQVAMESGLFTWLQLPYNVSNSSLGPSIDAAKKKGLQIIINRPFAEGTVIYDTEGRDRGRQTRLSALRFVVGKKCGGVVLVGTSSPPHLREDAELFKTASQVLAK